MVDLSKERLPKLVTVGGPLGSANLIGVEFRNPATFHYIVESPVACQ